MLDSNSSSNLLSNASGDQLSRINNPRQVTTLAPASRECARNLHACAFWGVYNEPQKGLEPGAIGGCLCLSPSLLLCQANSIVLSVSPMKNIVGEFFKTIRPVHCRLVREKISSKYILHTVTRRFSACNLDPLVLHIF